MSGPTYSHASHVDAVVKASNAQNGAREVLLEACRRANHLKPEVTFTKDQICDTCKMERPKCQKALRFLKAEGSLVPILNAEGGRNVPTTYAIRIAGQGEKIAEKGQSRGKTPDEERKAYWNAMRRKHGPIKALDMVDMKFGKI